MRIAALTMVYNEPVWASVWARHYASQLGAAHCLVLDHGSDDGSTEALGVPVERLERSPLDEDARAALISERVATLLRNYDAIIHTDADELLIADPAIHQSLAAAAAAEVTTAIGLDLQHLPGQEPPLQPGEPLGTQRRWVRFSAAMCKPALVRRPVTWTPGFHACDAPRATASLYLVHLRYADLGAGLTRLARTRAQDFARSDTNMHQRVSDAEFSGMMHDIARLPQVDGDLELLVQPWLARMQAGWAQGDNQLNLAGDALWPLPPRLRAAL